MKYYFVKGKLFVHPDGVSYAGLEYLTDEQEAFWAAHPDAKPHEVRTCMLDADRQPMAYPEPETEHQHETGV